MTQFIFKEIELKPFQETFFRFSQKIVIDAILRYNLGIVLIRINSSKRAEYLIKQYNGLK